MSVIITGKHGCTILTGVCVVILAIISLLGLSLWWKVAAASTGLIAVVSIIFQALIQSKEDEENKQREVRREQRERQQDERFEELARQIRPSEVLTEVSPADQSDDKPPRIFAKYVRSHLVGSHPYAWMVNGMYRAMGKDSYREASDFLIEIFVVKKEGEPVTLEDYILDAEIAGEWIVVPRMDDLSDYQLDLGETQSAVLGRSNKYQDLHSLSAELRGTPLVKGIGHTGWLRFHLVTENTNMKEKLNTKLTLVDALGNKYPVSMDTPLDKRGTIEFNPTKVKEWMNRT